jgi:hypothetical protein
MAIWKIWRPFGIFCGKLVIKLQFGIFFPVLVNCVEKNLAALAPERKKVECIFGHFFWRFYFKSDPDLRRASQRRDQIFYNSVGDGKCEFSNRTWFISFFSWVFCRVARFFLLRHNNTEKNYTKWPTNIYKPKWP